jgi:hypothetical protein
MVLSRQEKRFVKQLIEKQQRKDDKLESKLKSGRMTPIQFTTQWKAYYEAKKQI